MISPLGSSVILGFVYFGIGYLAQRSRICFIAGIRDYILVRDKELLLGLFSFFCTVWVLTSVLGAAGLLERGIPEYGNFYAGEAEGLHQAADAEAETEPPEGRRAKIVLVESPAPGEKGSPPAAGIKRILNRFFAAGLLGGWLIGFFAVFAGGCVLRQHVLCAQGQKNSLFFLLGFYAGSIAFYTLLYRFFQGIYG